jgi:hypothetical protein
LRIAVDCGHSQQQEKPDEFFAEVSAFLADTAAAI